LYYRLRRGRALARRELELDEEEAVLKARHSDLDAKFNPDDRSEANLHRMAHLVALKIKIDNLRDLRAEGKAGELLPRSFFIFPVVLFSFLGSFLFSYFHAFRRFGSGLEVFIFWWQNPVYGMTYFGAGLILSFISFFCPISSILIHVLNNWIALLLLGGV